MGLPAKKDRRNEILEAAARCVVEEGIDGTTMRMVAQSLNASTGLLTHYYANKKELILATLEAASTHLVESIGKEGGHPPGPEFIDAIFEFAFRGRDQDIPSWAFWLEYWGSATRDQDLKAVHAERVAKLRAGLRSSLAKGIEDGSYDPDLDIERSTEMLVALFYGLGVQVSLDPTTVTLSFASEVAALAHKLMTREQKVLRVSPLRRRRLSKHVKFHSRRNLKA